MKIRIRVVMPGFVVAPISFSPERRTLYVAPTLRMTEHMKDRNKNENIMVASEGTIRNGSMRGREFDQIVVDRFAAFRHPMQMLRDLSVYHCDLMIVIHEHEINMFLHHLFGERFAGHDVSVERV